MLKREVNEAVEGVDPKPSRRESEGKRKRGVAGGVSNGSMKGLLFLCKVECKALSEGG